MRQNPDGELCTMLLRAGMQSVVKEHLLDWARWWKEGLGSINRWTKQIDAGEEPDFSSW